MNEHNAISVLEPQKKIAPSKDVVTAPPASQSDKRPSLLARVWHQGPTLFIFALIGGLLVLGHQSGWSVPKFDEFFGAKNVVKDDWCEEHSVPESICVECNQTLLPRGKSVWCRKHGVHNCPFENPAVVQTASPPSVNEGDLERAKRALELKDRKENNSKCKLHHRRIQFASEDIIAKMGIEVEPVWRAPIIETVSASGEIAFEQPRVAPLSAPVAGKVWLVTEKGAIGTKVKRGDVLALIDAVEVGKAKAETLQAFAQIELRKRSFEMLKGLVPQGVIPESKLLEADLALREARIRLMSAQQTLTNMGLPMQIEESKVESTENLGKHLHFLGLPSDIASQLDPNTTTANLMPVIASRDGVVLAAKVSVGEVIEPGKALFVVADNSQMWLMLNVRSEDVGYLRVRDPQTNIAGQKVIFQADGSKQEVIGELIWKSAEVDEKTRTVQFRAELPNADRQLLAKTYGTGRIVLRDEKDAIVVPLDAVHWEGDCHIVFVRDKNFMSSDGKKVFEVRSVRPGVSNGSNLEIIAGVLPGELVATTNSASMRSELLKNNLGAG